MATATLISAATAEGTSANVTVAAGSSVQVYVTTHLGRRENVFIQRYNGSGYGKEVELLSEGKPWAMVTGPIVFRVRKEVTDESTAVFGDS